MPKVILVDENDRQTGLEEKLEAHRKGVLHRAVSVYIFNSKGELMMQRRAMGVYHSEGLWSNTCCTNCYEGEGTEWAAHRSLRNEMGFDCELAETFSTRYNTPVGGGLIENEYLHVFFGRYDGEPRPDSADVMGWKWMSMPSLIDDAHRNSGSYTAWLKILLGGELPHHVEKFMKNRNR